MKIRCANCKSDLLIREESREAVVCQSCGKRYLLEEARKIMGTPNCRNCIQHTINQYGNEIKEHCNIWGLDKCRNSCNRKEEKPRYRWTDANRWDRD